VTLKEGDPAPDIELRDERGETFRLSSLQARNVVLYFYPKADTPGCTTEACEFRDRSGEFAARDAVIIGVSPDSPGAQSRFKGKYELPFTLLADAEKAAAQAYGVWKEKNMYGRKVMGIERTTFLIGEDGRILKIFPKVKAKGHAEAVLQAMENRGQSPHFAAWEC
jgi:peroxiredoxin Q/BCP